MIWDGEQLRSEMYAWGLRNPFRFAFDPNAAGTRFFINDVGQSTFEEINDGIAGSNYGWPCYEGNGPQSAYQSAFQLCQQLPSSAPQNGAGPIAGSSSN